LLPDNENAHACDVVHFLQHLHRHIPGPLTIVWDRGHVHDKSKAVQKYLAKHPEIVTEKFPGYAPELNPDEQVWSYTKYGRMANAAPDNSHQLRRRLARELRRIRKRPDLLLSFIRHSKLPLLQNHVSD
jgi:transposase